MWNDRIDGKFITRVYDIHSKEERRLPEPIYHLSPDGKWALGIDYPRLNHMRRGYGYEGIPDKNHHQLAPENSYVYKMNLDAGDVINLISVAEVAKKFEPTKESIILITLTGIQMEVVFYLYIDGE